MNRRSIAACLAPLLVGALLTTVSSSTSAAAGARYVSNPTFAVNTSGWQPGPGDRLTRHRYPNRSTAGQVRPASSRARHQQLSVLSSASPSAIPVVDSTVDLSIRLRTSATPRRVVLRLEEVVGRTVVQRSTATTTVRSTAWSTRTRRLQTKTAGSRVRVYVGVQNMSGTRYMRLRSTRITVTPPPSTARSCDTIDYSDPAQGVQTFAEDFSGTRLDPDLWRVRDDTFLNHDAAYIDRDNVTVHDGYLDIAGRREPEQEWRSNPRSTYGETNRVRRYSTGYVDTIKKATYESPDAASSRRFSQRYGYFEARMWVPSSATMSQGVWPAFWLRADHTNGEIDVMESYGAPTTRNFDPSSSYEWNSWEDTSQLGSTAHFLRRPTMSTPIWQGWHTYGVNWSPTCLRYTFDGRTVGVARPISGEVPYMDGPSFEDTFHLRFNMQVGSSYWGWPDPSVTRDEFNFKIDWVRVHQRR